MKKFFISIMSLIVGISGYAVVEKTIEQRVETLESQVAELQSEVSLYHEGKWETTEGWESMHPITKPTTKPMTTKPMTTKPMTTMHDFSSKTEIIRFFNESVNYVKTNAKSVNQKSIVHYLAAPTTISSVVLKSIYNALGGDSWLDKTLMSNSSDEATYTGTDIKKNFPVENESWASKLTADDIADAKCTLSNGIYTITIKTKADAKTTSVQHGQGHNPKVFSVVLPEKVNDNIPGVAIDITGDAAMSYPSGTVVVKVDEVTGHVLEAVYDAHWTINFDKMNTVLPFATKYTYTISW